MYSYHFTTMYEVHLTKACFDVTLDCSTVIVAILILDMYKHMYANKEECSASPVEYATYDWGIAGSSLIDDTELCSWARHFAVSTQGTTWCDWVNSVATL